MLPIHLNRDLSNMTNPNEKRFELPPQATVAMYNEKDGIISDPPTLIEDIKSRTYQPKWTKVSGGRNYYANQPKTSALPTPGKMPQQRARNLSVPRPRMVPSFMITSPSSLRQNVASLPRREDGREQPFVGNYNVPK